MSEESGHWYTKDGRPCFQIKKKDGSGMRGIMLQHDRKLGLVPSVTTVLSIMNKHQLNIWKENQMMLASLTAQRRAGELDEDFCKRVREEAFQEVVVACDVGKEVHDALENHFKGGSYAPSLLPFVQGVIEELNEMYPDIKDWVAEKSFAHPLGFGGTCDLHSPSTGVVVDFKGKDGDFLDNKKLTYDQYVQLAGYQIGFDLPIGECANIFFSRTHPGIATHVKWANKDMKKGREIFVAALALWKASKQYDPSFKLKGSPFEEHSEVISTGRDND